MKLRELMTVIVEDVVIYTEVGEHTFSDIYSGRYRNVPQELLDREVRVVGVGHKNKLEIEVI